MALPEVAPTGRIGNNLIRWSVDDINSSAVGLPARNSTLESLIGKSDPPVVLISELIDWSIRIRVPPIPELLNEAFLLLRGG